MAKATTTIRQSLHYQPQHADCFAANQALFNRVVAFYFEVIQAHEKIVDLSSKEALTALETLTHTTSKNRAPVMPLTEIAHAIPAYFRRAAINAALGSAHSFSSLRKSWRTRKETSEGKKTRKGKKKPFTERPPVPPRTWNKSVPFYAGQQNLPKKSLILLTDVEAESRKRQVLRSPKMPNANVGHLPISQGMESATSMAPLKRERSGWRSAPSIFPANYACHWSRGHAPCLRPATTRECQKLRGFNPCGVSQTIRAIVNLSLIYPLQIERTEIFSCLH